MNIIIKKEFIEFKQYRYKDNPDQSRPIQTNP